MILKKNPSGLSFSIAEKNQSVPGEIDSNSTVFEEVAGEKEIDITLGNIILSKYLDIDKKKCVNQLVIFFVSLHLNRND